LKLLTVKWDIGEKENVLSGFHFCLPVGFSGPALTAPYPWLSLVILAYP
jgi:hypothetical protein